MSRCELCPGIYDCLPIDGPQDSDIFLCGEAPGILEQKKGRVFIGKTGEEFSSHYLPLSGLHRENVTVTNVIRCLPDRPKGKLDLNRARDRELLASCTSTFLYPSIESRKPKLLIPMGAFACHAIDPAINLDLHHGMPVETRFGIPAFPMWHPAAGLHEPKKMMAIRTDWIRLRRYLRGTLRLPVDEFPEPDYQEATKADISDIDPTIPLAGDTESSRLLGPYFLTWSQQPGMGRLIRANRPDLLVHFQKKLDKFKALIYYHNWLYDWTVTEDMGLVFPVKLMRDTMVQAFNLGNVPQGLKALAFRLLGMEMQDFEDLVKPYSTVEVLRYYKLAQTFEWEKPEQQLVIDDTTKKWKLYKPHSMKTKLKIFFTAAGKNPDKDIFKAWDTWEAHQQELEEKCGPYPGLDIAHVPFDEAAYYAMRDSDACIRLVPIFKKMRELAHSGKLQEQWEL